MFIINNYNIVIFIIILKLWFCEIYSKKLMCITEINTFTFQRFAFKGKNEQFLLENWSYLTHKFLYDNINMKILLNFLVKIVIRNHMCQVWCILNEKWLIFFSKTRRWEPKVLIYNNLRIDASLWEVFLNSLHLRYII